MNDIHKIKEQLVNVSLIVASVIGLPLTFASVLRALSYNINLFIYSHIAIYLVILAVTLFQKKLPYFIKASTIIIFLFVLAFVDLLKTGFLSAVYIWLTAAIVITALYFNFRKSIVSLIASLIIILIFYYLIDNEIIEYNIDLNEHGRQPVTIIMRTLNIIMIGLMITFSIRHIQSKLNANIIDLKQQKDEIEKNAEILKKENEIRKSSELRALNNEKNFRNIFEYSSEAILIISSNGYITDFNQAFLNLSGYSESEVLNMRYEKLLSKEDADTFKPYQNHLDKLPLRFDLQHETRDGKKKNVECSTSEIYYNNEKALLLMIRDYTEKLANEKSSYLAAITAEEKEKARFSKELHDGLGPLLSTLKIYLEIYFNNPDDEEIQLRIETTLNESIKSVKEISNNLSPYVLENLGLLKAVESFIEKIKYVKRINIDFSSNLTYRLSSEVEISVYRFITELINNTIKHGNANGIRIVIDMNHESLLISYKDDGIGFDMQSNIHASKGIGLLNLRSRIENLGGKTEMETSPGNGFSITAKLKIDKKTIGNGAR